MVVWIVAWIVARERRSLPCDTAATFDKWAPIRASLSVDIVDGRQRSRFDFLTSKRQSVSFQRPTRVGRDLTSDWSEYFLILDRHFKEREREEQNSDFRRNSKLWCHKRSGLYLRRSAFFFFKHTFAGLESGHVWTRPDRRVGESLIVRTVSLRQTKSDYFRLPSKQF